MSSRKPLKAVPFPQKSIPKRSKIEIVREIKQPTLNKVQRTEVKKLISKQQEHKYFETRNTGAVDWAGTIVDLSAVPQGDTDSTRDADTLMPTSLVINYIINLGDTTNFFRVIVFRWHDKNTTPTVAQILQSNSSSTGGVISDYDHDYRQNFNVLYDKTHTLVSGASNAVIIKNMIRLPLAKKAIQYVSGGTGGGEKLWALAISDSSAIAHPSWWYNFRLNYTDS